MRSAMSGLKPFHETAIDILNGDGDHVKNLYEMGVLPDCFDDGDEIMVKTMVVYLLASSVVPDAAKEDVMLAALNAVMASAGDHNLTTATIWLFINHDQDNEFAHVIVDNLTYANEKAAEGAMLESTIVALNRLAVEVGAMPIGVEELTDDVIESTPEEWETATN